MADQPPPRQSPPALSSRRELQAFLDRAQQLAVPGNGGRLLFALDATASRQPTWDLACSIQAEMFDQAAAIGGLEVQLAWYRGHREFRHSAWVRDARALAAEMTRVGCRAGATQIGRLLDHAWQQTRSRHVDAVVFVGDCLEEQAPPLYERAGRLAMLRTPLFVFHEGHDPVAGPVFRELCRISGGACLPFDAASPAQLRALLRGVAAWAAGGREALAALAGQPGQGLLERLLAQLPAPADR